MVADEDLIAPPGAKEHVANLCQSTMLFGIVVVVGAGFHSIAWVRCFRCDIGRMPFLRLRWQWIVLQHHDQASHCSPLFWSLDALFVFGLPSLLPLSPNAAALRVGLCMSPRVQYHLVYNKNRINPLFTLEEEFRFHYSRNC